MIESANAAYVDRDKAFHQINEIKKLAQKETKEYENELRELMEQTERPVRDSGFVSAKSSTRHKRGSSAHMRDMHFESMRPKSARVN